MKKMREITNEKDTYIDNFSTQIRRIEKLPLPYTGNKKKLLHHISQTISKYDVQFDTILDAFSGSASVSLLFKVMGKKVISNDLLTSSYINSVAFVENSGIKLTLPEQEFILNHKNKNKGTFVEDNYLGTQYRRGKKECRFNKFTLKECRQLDNFRANIDELCGIHAQSLGLAANAAVVMRLPFGSLDASTNILTHRKKQQDNYGKTSKERKGGKDRRIGIYYDDEFNLRFDKWFKKYIQDFMQGAERDGHPPKIKRAAFLANLQQHVLRDCFVGGRMNMGQALAEVADRLAHQKNQLKARWDNQCSTEMDFITKGGEGNMDRKPGQGFKWWSFTDAPGSCIATNMDVVDLLQSGHCCTDAAYFDPPYGGQSSDYATIYRFLEEYIYSSPLEDMPHIANHAKKFVGKKGYEDNFVLMLQSARHIPIWMFSYNDTSWRTIGDIVDIIKQFKAEVIVETMTDKYQYKYRKNQGRTEQSSEYLIIAR